jgi:hypothetical protein
MVWLGQGCLSDKVRCSSEGQAHAGVAQTGCEVEQKVAAGPDVGAGEAPKLALAAEPLESGSGTSASMARSTLPCLLLALEGTGFGTDDRIANCIIGAPPRHPLMRNILASMEQGHAELLDFLGPASPFHKQYKISYRLVGPPQLTACFDAMTQAEYQDQDQREGQPGFGSQHKLPPGQQLEQFVYDQGNQTAQGGGPGPAALSPTRTPTRTGAGTACTTAGSGSVTTTTAAAADDSASSAAFGQLYPNRGPRPSLSRDIILDAGVFSPVPWWGGQSMSVQLDSVREQYPGAIATHYGYSTNNAR